MCDSERRCKSLRTARSTSSTTSRAFAASSERTTSTTRITSRQNGTLGRLLVRYRTTRHGDWRELGRCAAQRSREGPFDHIHARGPGADARIAEQWVGATGAAGVRGLNDGLVPPPPAGGGRGGGPGAAGATADVPLFTWSGSRGPTQWVQYTFPDDQEVSSVEVFWVRPPKSWRLVYQAAVSGRRSTRRVRMASPPSAFSKVEFAPVRRWRCASKRRWRRTTRSASRNGELDRSRGSSPTRGSPDDSVIQLRGIRSRLDGDASKRR